MLTFEMIQDFVIVLLAICSFVVAIWGSVKAVREALAPLNTLMERLDEDERRLDRDNRRIKDLEDSNRLLLKAIDQLIEHEITNNHFDKLREVQEEIHDYLINR